MRITHRTIDNFVKAAEKLQSRAFNMADKLNDAEQRHAAHMFSELDLALDRFVTGVNRGKAYDELTSNTF